MSNSSQQPNLSYDLSNITILGSSGSDTITVSPSAYSYTYDTTTTTMSSAPFTSISTTTGAGGAYGTISINGISCIDSTVDWLSPKEWVGAFPAWARVDDMCKQYPALEIALRNFQTIYQLVKDDYDNPAPKK